MMADSPRQSDLPDAFNTSDEDPFLTPALKARSVGIIDLDVFCQITELDEEGDRSFSKGMVWDYFEQVETHFGKIDAAVGKRDLPGLSELGHFLKGSSAALGLKQVQASCEKIQNYGKRMEEPDGPKGKLAPAEALAKIAALLSQAKTEYARAETWLRAYYGEGELPPEPESPKPSSPTSSGRAGSDKADPRSPNGLPPVTTAATSSSPPPRGSPTSPRSPHAPPRSPTTERPTRS